MPEASAASADRSKAAAQDFPTHEAAHPPEQAADGRTGSFSSSARNTLSLAALSLGVIYGDIGTSPLYTFNGIFPEEGPVPSAEDVLGAASCIIWAFLLVPVLKYALVALEFGTREGEGGPFAVYTALFPPSEPKEDGWRTLTTYTEATSPPSSTKATRFLRRPAVKFALFALVVFGVSLTIADGMLTPAVSVRSAVTGIAVAAPSVSDTGSIVGISCAFLVVLFLLQALGTKKIAYLFSPIVSVWLLLCAVGGAINIAKHPGVFRAFDPSRAVLLFVRTDDYDLLSGVILAITGSEALFANLGHFSKGSIRLAFLAFATPCLILQYFGQAARLIEDGETILPNIFYQSIPGGVGNAFWWVTWAFSILAAIIGSQGMISATFSLIQQLTKLHVFPPLRIIHTDSVIRGRVYIPVANFLLFVGTIGLTVGFRGNNSGLTSAYGFAVAGVLLISTSMIALAIVQLKHLPILVALVYFVFSGFIDGLFLGATAKKVPHGAWFPLGVACVLLVFLLLWWWAKGLENSFDLNHRWRLSEIMRPAPEHDEDGYEDKHEPHGWGREADITAASTSRRDSDLGLRRRQKLPMYEMTAGGTSLARPPVFALFHNHSSVTSEGAPHAFTAFLSSYPALPQIIVFLTLRTVGVPHVAPHDRFLVDRQHRYEGVYAATISFGYRNVVDLSDIAGHLRTRIIALEMRSATCQEDLDEMIEKVDTAVKGAVTHILPRFYISADQSPHRPKIIRVIRTFLLEEVYRRVAVNFDPSDHFVFGSQEDVLRMGVAAVV
ncbi:hypothetical protein JCM6882_001949 [Rhodosporidiobolus microsporus]